MNIFPSNIVNNFKITECVNCDPIIDNINDRVISSIAKYIKQPKHVYNKRSIQRTAGAIFSLFTYPQKLLKKTDIFLDFYSVKF